MIKINVIPALLMSICAIGLSLSGCKGKLDKDVAAFTSRPIYIPENQMIKRACSYYTDTLTQGKTLRLVNYLDMDSVGCSSCELSQLASQEAANMERKDLRKVEFVYVVKTSPEKYEASYSKLCNARLKGTVYFDTARVFLNHNPHFPSSKLFHTFVINRDGKIVIVGSPFKNEKMQKLFDKVLSKN